MRRSSSRVRHLLGAALAATLAAGAALAEVDPPLSQRSVPPPRPDDPLGEVRCTLYADLMVRETGVDTPAPGRPAILPARAPCGPARGGTPAGAAGFTFAGRKGPFLLFTATDPNGATPLIVTNLAGKDLYRDALMDTFVTVELQDGQLRIAFLRGINASCSVAKGGQACWARIAREAHLPPAVATLPAPVQLCTAAYAPGEDQANPSLITYPVTMTIGADGKSTVLSRGALGCRQVP